MNKRELIEATALAAGMNRKDSERALNTALEIIAAALAEGQQVKLSGFGTFQVRHRGARAAQNPQTGEKVAVPENDVPIFKASRVLKKAIENKE